MKTAANLKVTTPSDREIMMTRIFDAPRSLVFDCYTKPELIKRWLTGPEGWSLVVCDNDLRVGGAFRWVWRGPPTDGKWAWAASIGTSCVRSGSSGPNCSTKTGPVARRWGRWS